MKPGNTLDVDSSTELKGYYGAEPRVESLTLLRNDLYRQIDTDIRNWINERRFIPRFLLAAGAFLITFFFLSLVIRDPIPLVDEFLGSSAVGVFIFLIIGRRFEQSRTATERRIMLRAKVDGVVFTESAFVRKMEHLLEELEGQELERAGRLGSLTGRNDVETDSNSDSARGIKVAVSTIKSEYPDETAQVIMYLRNLAAQKPYKNLQRQMKRKNTSVKTDNAVRQGAVIPAAVVLLDLLQRR